MQIIKARGKSGGNFLKWVNTRFSEIQLTFIITYYPTFLNVRNIMQELKILIAPNKGLKKRSIETYLP